MCIQKVGKTINLLVFFLLLGAILCGCEAMDNILSSAGAYKINAQIDGVPLEECSYVKSSDNINFSFEESVSDDPDVSSLMVYLKTASGDIVGQKIIYTLDEETGQKEEKQSIKELFISVKNLDDELPSFSLPENLAVGKYTLVLQVMKDKEILQKTEKNIFNLGRTSFSYEGINVYLSGAVDTSHLIPKGSVVMLEANLNFDSHLNPYIIWYDGKNKIGEGKFSDGAGSLFWEAPEQNGFFSLCAEIFPVERSEGLSGYKKEISLLVSSNVNNINLVSANIDQLTHWYVMEGNLNDSKNPGDVKNVLSSGSKNKPKWMGLDGTYGVATGYNNVLKLPKISIANKDTEVWQTLFRFKPLSNGVIFLAEFGSSDVSMILSIEEKNLILTLTSQQKTVSQTVSISKESNESSEGIQAAGKDLSFLVAGVKFSIKSGVLSAQINITGNPTPVELAVKPITLEAKIKNEINIFLGFLDNSSLAQIKKTDNENEALAKIKTNASTGYNVLWDEFALYYMPPINILTKVLEPVTNKEQQITIANK